MHGRAAAVLAFNDDSTALGAKVSKSQRGCSLLATLPYLDMTHNDNKSPSYSLSLCSYSSVINL